MADDPRRCVVSLRVLWVIKGLGPGGAEQLLVNQARVASADITYAVRYLVPEKNHLVPALEAAGVDVSCDPAPRPSDLGWVRRLRRELASGRFDVVHVHSPYVAAWVRIAMRSLPTHRRPALVYTEHNRWAQYGWPTRLANRLTYGQDDWQIAVSDGVRESIASRRRAAVETIVHGIDLDATRRFRAERAAVRAELGIDDGVVVAGTVANFRAEKAYPDLLAAAGRVDPNLPLVFVSVGQGPLEEEIRRLHRASGLGGRFRLLGYRPDATRVMAAFDMFVLSSHHEGLPVAVMEAQALGLPVVATATGGLPEVVDQSSGWLVPVGRPDLLAVAIEKVAKDSRVRAAMGRCAQQSALRFDIRISTRRIEEGYRNLVAAGGRR